MRILVVSSYPPRHCGIGAYARDQVARLRAEGHSVTVLSPPDGAGDVRAPFVGGAAFRRAARVGAGFDQVIVHFQPALYYKPRAPLSKVMTSASLWWLTTRRSVHAVIHEADPPIRWRPDYVLLRAALGRAFELRFHTLAEMEAFQAAYGMKVRGSVIGHVVQTVGMPPSRAQARHSLGIDGSTPVFVVPGFLQPSKGVERALPAFEGSGRARLWIVGSVRDRTAENVAYVESLRRQTDELIRVSLVEQFLGDEEFDRWIAAADWVVLPYRTSWSSGVLARAQAIGTPAVVTSVGGLAEQAGPHDVVVADDDAAVVRTVIELAASAVPATRRGSA
jgi:glycosyltransferase involved in cell wall biosynthesis